MVYFFGPFFLGFCHLKSIPCQWGQKRWYTGPHTHAQHISKACTRNILWHNHILLLSNHQKTVYQLIKSMEHKVAGRWCCFSRVVFCIYYRFLFFVLHEILKWPKCQHKYTEFDLDEGSVFRLKWWENERKIGNERSSQDVEGKNAALCEMRCGLLMKCLI